MTPYFDVCSIDGAELFLIDVYGSRHKCNIKIYMIITFISDMVFKRVWDTCCPHVWDTWEANGITWVIRDLRPEDDEEALQILLEHLCPDEPLTIISG